MVDSFTWFSQIMRVKDLKNLVLFLISSPERDYAGRSFVLEADSEEHADVFNHVKLNFLSFFQTKVAVVTRLDHTLQLSTNCSC